MNDTTIHSGIHHGKRGVVVWLMTVLVTIVIMVLVGGITRLTESGLSIVDWRPLMGAIPPLNESQWQQTFLMYQNSPQFQLVNSHMDLSEFKQIFFWEYIHRLLGRLIGLMFALPFLVFWLQKRFNRAMSIKLLVALALGGLQGLMGWYMVKSGLVDVPRVSHLRLAAHLGLALLIAAYLWWLILDLRELDTAEFVAPRGRKLVSLWLTGLVSLQIIYGALVAGLRAGWGYNTFPKMGDYWIPPIVTSLEPWWHNLVFNNAGVQFTHRWLGTLVVVFAVWFWVTAKGTGSREQQRSIHAMLVIILLQFLLGVYTLINV